MSDADSKPRYTASQLLGHGGMSEVVEARDLHLDRSVAMQVIRAEKDPLREVRLRFIQEVRVLSQL